MLQLFIFLVLALIVYYVVKPEKINQVWLSAIIIPLCGIFVYALIAYVYFANFANTNIAPSYLIGGATAKCFLPTIISGIVIFFLLKSKMKNENRTKFPIALVIFIGISLIGTIVQSVLQNKNEKLVREYYSDIENNSYNEDITTNQSFASINNLDFNGLTFSYPDNWKIETEVLQEDLGFQVNCEKKGLNSSEVLAITWLRLNYMTPKEMIESTIESMKEEPTHKNAKVGSLFDTSFKGLDATSVDFSIILFGESFYGRMTSFIMNENIVLMLKQSDTKDKLNTEFQLMEESFNLK